jgi:hypothetical protein
LAVKKYHNWIIKAMDSSSQTLVKDLIELLGKYNLKEKIIAYVKDEGSNLNIMIRPFKFGVNCDI